MLLYLLFALPALILGLWAQARVQRAYREFSRVGLSQRLTGAQVARRILDSQGLAHVQVEAVSGWLSDHYDPLSRTLRLSPEVYQGQSVAAAGIAAHEAGHALQHAQHDPFLMLRSAMVPSVQFGSWLGPIVFFIGFFLAGVLGTWVAWAGVALFGLTALFALVTLPVEFDASRRAKQLLSSQGIAFGNEIAGVSKVLDAAALTYVAGAIGALSTLLYYVFLLTGFNRD